MPQKITKSVKSMVEAAKREIEEMPAADAVKLFGRDDVVLVDLRDPRERERDGKVPGTFNVTRGMLEFWIDPESSYYKPRFGEDKKFVFFCAGGLRSALGRQDGAGHGAEAGRARGGRVQGLEGGRWSDRTWRGEEGRREEVIVCHPGIRC